MNAATDNLIGQLVISRNTESTFNYQGEPDDDRFERWEFAMGSGERPKLWASLESVAPADIEIPASSDRIEIIKHAKKPGYWAAGPWELRIDGEHCGWHRIKREAMAAGLKAVAITEWHERLDANTEAFMNASGLDVNDSAAWEASRAQVMALVSEGIWSHATPEADK